jgi:hypothetical protein
MGKVSPVFTLRNFRFASLPRRLRTMVSAESTSRTIHSASFTASARSDTKGRMTRLGAGMPQSELCDFSGDFCLYDSAATSQSQIFDLRHHRPKPPSSVNA